MQHQPNRFSCLLVAFANCLDVPYNDIIQFLGHDGSKIINPDLADPYCRRAFHPQELVEYALIELNRPVVMIGSEPILSNRVTETLVPVRTNFKSLLSKYRGVLTNRHHAVSWIDNRLIDPTHPSVRSIEYTIENFDPTTFFICF